MRWLIAGLFGAIFGVIVGLPALRLRTFYFAMTTLGFATIVTQVALAWKSVTGGGVGVPGPVFPWPFDSPWGFYYFCLGLAVICTWMTTNVAASRFGRSLVAIRDAEVAAESVGISKPALLVTVFLFSGAVAGIAGGLFASLQSYITPDAFTFDLSVLFFIAILIGGRGSILGTAARHDHSDRAARIRGAAGGVVHLSLCGASAGDRAGRARRHRRDAGLQEPPAARAASRDTSAPRAVAARDGRRMRQPGLLTLKDVSLSFGGVRAIDGVDLEIRTGEVHGLIGPNGSGKTTTLNVISGYYAPQQGQVRLNEQAPCGRVPRIRAPATASRAPSRPHGWSAKSSVLENVMIGGTTRWPRHALSSRSWRFLAIVATRRHLREAATAALAVVGLDQLAHVRSDRLQHSELRFVEIARALMLRPAFLLLDEPAAGLSVDEIKRLGALIVTISRRGTGVLLVEHHADLIFDICDRVTVLNLGKVLASGTPAEIRAHREVVNAYLGA